MSFSKELGAILSEELELYKALGEIAYGKTDIIAENNVEALEKLTKKEESLINQIGLAEGTRLKVLDSWGLAVNTSLSDLIEKIPDGAEHIIELKDELTEVLNSIRERNTLNNELIEENLQWLDFNMNLISNTKTGTTYGKDREDSGVNDSLFDRKV